MWGLLPRACQITIVLSIGVIGVAGISGLSAWLTGEQLHQYQCISMVVSLITLVCIPFAEWIWRPIWRMFPVLNKLLFPDLNGTWEGNLVSTWKDPVTQQSPPPIPATFWIKQRIFSVSIKMKTGESHSFSTRCLVEADKGAEIFRLWYGYDNRPNAEVSHRSARHDGAAWLEVDLSSAPDELVGQYYTQRKTNGDIRIKKIAKIGQSGT